MSLISDALKKARQEAARQDSLRQSLPYAVGSTSAPDRARSYAPLLAGLAVGLLLAGGLAGLFYFVSPGSEEKPEARVAETAPAPVPPVVIEEAPAPPAEPVTPSVVPQLTEPVVPETAPPAPVPPPVREVQPEPQPQPEPPPAPVLVLPSPPVTEPVAPPAPQTPVPRESRSYVGEVPVPGGGVVRLNGIAFSTESPVAVLDGKVVGPGEVVQGFTVVEIRQNQVKLEGHGETVFVSLK
jgi:hypothetical protein